MDGREFFRSIGLASLAFGMNAFLSTQVMSGPPVVYDEGYNDPAPAVQSCEPSFRGGICDDYCLNMWRGYCMNRHHKSCGSPRHCLSIGCGLLLHCRDGCLSRLGLGGHYGTCGTSCAHGNCASAATPVESQPPVEHLNPPAQPSAEAAADSTPSSQTVPTQTFAPPFPGTAPLPSAITPEPEPNTIDVPSLPTQTLPAEPPVPPAPPVPVLESEQPAKEADPEIPSNVLPFGLDEVGADAPLPPMPTSNSYIRTVSKRRKSMGTARLLDQLERVGQRR